MRTIFNAALDAWSNSRRSGQITLVEILGEAHPPKIIPFDPWTYGTLG